MDQTLETTVRGLDYNELKALERLITGLLRVRMPEIKVGDGVRINRDVRPKYLAGSTGTVTHISRRRGGKLNAEVKLDDEYVTERATRFINPLTGTVGVPVDLLEARDG